MEQNITIPSIAIAYKFYILIAYRLTNHSVYFIFFNTSFPIFRNSFLIAERVAFSHLGKMHFLFYGIQSFLRNGLEGINNQ